MEEVIIIHKFMITQEEDIAFENIRRIKYKPKLSTKRTWLVIGELHTNCGLDKAVWFHQATAEICLHALNLVA